MVPLRLPERHRQPGGSPAGGGPAGYPTGGNLGSDREHWGPGTLGTGNIGGVLKDTQPGSCGPFAQMGPGDRFPAGLPRWGGLPSGSLRRRLPERP